MQNAEIKRAYSVLIAYAAHKIDSNILLENAEFGEGEVYNDFNNTRALTQNDIKKISIEAKKAISRGMTIEYDTVSSAQAEKLIEEKKIAPIADIEAFNNEIPLIKIDDFYCVGSPLEISNTKELSPDSFKLQTISGTNADKTGINRSQRLTSLAFENKGELDAYIQHLKDAQERDHRKINQDMDLFCMSQNGPGLAMFQPNGAIIRRTIEEFEHFEHAKRGYKPVYTPHIYTTNVWKQSGHYDCYKDNMFLFEQDGKEYGVKPMNCPGHVEIFKNAAKSYRDLPIKYFELGTVYRKEDSGALHGLLRVTNITQDDAHIFCTKEQLKGEIVKVVDFVEFMMKTFGLETEYEISTKPEKAIGNEETWELAERTLHEALKSTNIKEYGVDQGGGAFYGPKIDVKMKDALGRKWQGPTIQLDFNFPERFNLEFTNANGEKERPIMLHRTVLGSMERFTGVLIEHYNGKFPLWLAPEQVAIVTVSEDNEKMNAYKEKVAEALMEKGFRVETSSIRGNSLSAKVAKARRRRIPYTVIIGENEADNNTVALHIRDDNSKIKDMPLEDFIKALKYERKTKALKSVLIAQEPTRDNQNTGIEQQGLNLLMIAAKNGKGSAEKN